MEPIIKRDGAAIYELTSLPRTKRYITTTPESRSICNDPLVYGVSYTSALRTAVTKTFKLFKEAGIEIAREKNSLILNILRGGLNYGIRDALFAAYGWSDTSSAFISSQRVFTDAEGWQISENSYRKMPHIADADVIFGDVVATGTSLRHALAKLIEEKSVAGTSYRTLTFFTIGSAESERILEGAAAQCAELFPHFQGARMIYIEGIFGVPDKTSSLSIALQGTDLLRHPATLAPEFIESQKEALTYALERCTIYDAGSRAFDPHEYLTDVKEYWRKVEALGASGMSVYQYLQERFPEDSRLQDAVFEKEYSRADSLQKVAQEHLKKLKATF
jgi:hypothetical protein